MKVLYLAWRDPKGRTWFPVGRLSFDGKVYRFVYTRGAKQSPNFLPFARMEDLTTIYESDELFPLFANRLLSKKRPEYQEFLQWLNTRPGEDDPLTSLALEGFEKRIYWQYFPVQNEGRTTSTAYSSSAMDFVIYCLKPLRESTISPPENSSTSCQILRTHTTPVRSHYELMIP